ncbi:MAG TPA: LamG-like jellyroll fold domain-containing protein [Alphaproteobacteria bacterium]|nr:LamG-like jellyroll fold domain-containing protein [Alphaproteobacteria bacterium]
MLHYSDSNSYPEISDISSSDITGKVVHGVYNGFSDPSSRLGTNVTNFTFNNDSDIVYMSLNINDYFIYNTAYVSFDGQDWLEFTLTPQGELKNGWIRNSAIATLGMNKNNMRLNATKNESSENYVIVYSCSKPNPLSNAWDCHDGWQIINFKAILKKPPIIDFDSDGYPSNNDCNDNNANVNPSRVEVCGNGLDDDCSGGDSVCGLPTCSDGIRNGNETGVDCGGAQCSACSVGTVLACSSCTFVLPANNVWARPQDFPGLKGGDTICIPAGVRGQVSLNHLRGSPGNPIIITNCGAGQAIINGSVYPNHAFWIENSTHFRVTGTGDPNTPYGIKVLNHQNSGVVTTGKSNYMEFDHIEISGGAGTGFSLKSDPRCDGTTNFGNFTQYNTSVHDNYVHDNGNEGLYLGSSHFILGGDYTCNGVAMKLYEHEVRMVRVYNNIFVNTGNDGIQVGSAVSDVEIYNNTVINAGRANNYGHTASVMINPGTVGKLYNNYIDGGEQGIFMQGHGGNYVYNNIIKNTRADAIMTTGYASFVKQGFGYHFDNNLIINATGYGIWHITLNTTGSTFRNNIVIGAKNGAIRLNTGQEQLIISNNLNSSNISYYRFANPNASDYHYTSSSPMIDAGTSTANTFVTFDKDLVSRPRNSAYDIGPYEFAGAPSNATNATNTSNSTNPVINSCGCNFVISLSGTEWEFNGSQRGVKPGDKICFSNGNRTGIGFINVHGTASNPITITNMCNGSVNITAPSNWGNAIGISNTSNIIFTGSGNPNIFYGIKIRGATMGLNLQGLSSDLEVDHVNISGVGSSALVVKTDPTCNPATWRGNFVLRNVKIHDNYISNTQDEGMYIGNSHYDNGVSRTCNNVTTTVFEHDVDNVQIYNNILRDIGNEGIQVGSTKNLVMHHNFVYNSGRLNHVQHQNGYQLGGGTEGAIVYNNYLDTTSGFCILDGGGGNTYYNNILINCNMSGMQLQDVSANYAPQGFVIINNIFINPGTEGIFFYSTNPLQSYFQNNIVVTNRTSGFRFIAYNHQPSARLTVSNNINTTDITSVRFVNPSAKDYHLQSNSPAIDTGINGATYGVTVDYDGVSRPRNSGYDIGAYEFTGTPTGQQPAATDSDSDGYNSTVDCNDNNAAIWTYRTGYTDSDGDGYTTGSSQQICSGNSLPSGYSSASSGTDCVDSNANVNPAQTEICGNSLDDDCSAGDLACPVAPTCSDGIQNGNETGVDCGGAQCSACQVVSEPTLPSGALFSYPFTTNANDATGNGYNGVVTGATWTAQGSGGSYSFDGNDYITVSNANSLDGLSGLTVEVWTLNPVLQDHEYLVGKRKDLDAPWSLYAHNSGYWTFTINSTSGVTTPVVTGQWTHIVGTWNGTVSKIYTDGVLRNSYSFFTNMPSYPSNNVIVGAREAGSNKVYHYQGKIGEVHVYNRALSQSEITSRYDDTKGKYS